MFASMNVVSVLFPSRKSQRRLFIAHRNYFTKVKETQEAGGTQVMLQGGLHPSLPLNIT